MTTPPEPATPAATAAGTPSGSTKWLALAAMMFAVAMIFIDQTIVSIAIPTIQSELQLSEQGVQWIVNGYLLSLSAFFVLGGRLSDIFGHKRMVLLGVTIFAVSSALCGATPAGTFDEAWLITFRITQGIGAALLFPAALAVVVSAFPLKERGKALALFFGITGGLTAIGPILGGYLSTWTWRAIFWVNVPVAIIAVILTLMAHIHTKHKKEPIDYLGAVLIASGMALSVLGLQQASTWGWWDVKTIGSILLGLILLAAFFKVETRVPVPLVKVAIFKDRAFFVDNAVLFFAMMAFVPVFFFGSVYSQAVLGYSASEAGLYLLVFFAGFAPGVQVGGRMLDKSGARSSVIVGSAIAAIGFFFWAQKLTDYSLGAQWPFIVMGGAGIGLLLGPASTDAVNRSINASYGEVTGINQTIRNYGSSSRSSDPGNHADQHKHLESHRDSHWVRSSAGSGNRHWHQDCHRRGFASEWFAAPGDSCRNGGTDWLRDPTRFCPSEPSRVLRDVGCPGDRLRCCAVPPRWHGDPGEGRGRPGSRRLANCEFARSGDRRSRRFVLDSTGQDVGDQDATTTDVVEVIHDRMDVSTGNHRPHRVPSRLVQRSHCRGLQAGGDLRCPIEHLRSDVVLHHHVGARGDDPFKSAYERLARVVRLSTVGSNEQSLANQQWFANGV